MSLSKLAKYQNISLSIIAHLILLLNKIRYKILGYRSPRTFSVDDINKAVDYDYDVIQNWNGYLQTYLKANYDYLEKNVLELGPGGDLGIGLLFLSKGVRKYNAIDVNDLVKYAPLELYDALMERLRKSGVDDHCINYLVRELEKYNKGENGLLNYIHSENFDIPIFRNEDIDLIVSNAAFEHFDSINRTIKEMSEISKPGTILVTEIDLSTHTRWIRDVDPLNIYRVSERIYKLLHYSGIPNRIRPYQYMEMLSEYGWHNVKCYSKTILDNEYIESVEGYLSSEFRDSKNEMQDIHVVICATKQ